MMLDGRLVQVTDQPNHVLVEFMAQAEQFPERANAALRELWNRYTHQLCGSVARQNPERKALDHEQAVNDAFLKAFEHASDFLVKKLNLLAPDKKDAAVVGWLWRIATNKMKDQMRKKRPETLSLEGDELDLAAKELARAWQSQLGAPEPESKPSGAQVWVKRLEWLQEILKGLPYRDQKILVESYRNLDPRTGHCIIPDGIRTDLRNELGITDNNLRRRRAWLVDKLTIELLALELKDCGHAKITPAIIVELCKKVGIPGNRLHWFVKRISARV
jgi:DNA-directed RNA polymerase specialized sigma24 family protein